MLARTAGVLHRRRFDNAYASVVRVAMGRRAVGSRQGEDGLARRSQKKSVLPKVVAGVGLLVGAVTSQLAKTPAGKLWAFAGGLIATAILFIAIVWIVRRVTADHELLLHAGKNDPWPDHPDWHDGWQRVEPRGTPTLNTSTWSVDLLRALEWHRVEILCVAYFEALGFKATATPFGADGGVDIHLYAKGSSQCAILVQCKAWIARDVGVKTVRELFGVMAAENVSEGVLVTTGSFTQDARAFASETKVHLIDGPDLLKKLQSLPAEQSQTILKAATDGDFTTPTCPSCGIPMVRRTTKAEKNDFWGCRNYPRCRQILHGSVGRQ